MPQQIVAPGDQTTIYIQLADGADDQYPQAKLYNPDGDLVATLNLTHIADGFYSAKYTPDGSAEYLSGNVIVYSDSDHTQKNELYSAEAWGIIVKRFSTPMPSGGVEFGLTLDDLEALKKWLEDELTKVKQEIKKKPEIKPPKIEVPQPNFKPYADKILEAIGKISLPDNSSLLKQIKQSVDKLPKDAPQIDWSPIVDLLKKLSSLSDRTAEILTEIRKIPKSERTSQISHLPLREQIIALRRIIEKMPDKDELKNILILLDENNAKRIDYLAKTLNKIVPSLRAEYEKYDQEKEKKIKFKELLDEVFI